MLTKDSRCDHEIRTTRPKAAFNDGKKIANINVGWKKRLIIKIHFWSVILYESKTLTINVRQKQIESFKIFKYFSRKRFTSKILKFVRAQKQIFQF